MPRSRPPIALHLGVSASESVDGLCAAIIAEVTAGRLADGDLLPSSRALADQLGVTRGRVVEAYTRLTAAGLVVTAAGSGTWVDRGAAAAAKAGAVAAFAAPGADPLQREVSLPPTRFDLRPGFPDLGLLNGREWNRCWKRAAATLTRKRDQLAPGPRDQLVELQVALSNHLRLSRGVSASPEQILLFNGVGQAIRTIAGAIGSADRTLAFEDPGYNQARRAFTHSGAVIRSVPVDGSGLRVDELCGADWGVYVTPAHQFPLGVRMPAVRRQALLDWAGRSGGYIFEDDYDGEFRYDVAPIPPLRTMIGGADHVVYIGTASKIVARELRIAWAVVPAVVHEAVAQAQRLDGEPISSIGAAAFSELIATGALLRHLAASHRTYAARRRRFTEAWHRVLPGARVLGIDAGLHLVVTFETGFDDCAAAAALAKAGVQCAPLSQYAVNEGWSGLVCGYSQLPETSATAAVSAIREVLAELDRSR